MPDEPYSDLFNRSAYMLSRLRVPNLKMPIEKIKNINIAITNKCNLKCRHCDIWKEQPKKDISLRTIGEVLDSQMLDADAGITLTGGEPFLHAEFSGLAEIILKKRPNSLKTISTNGTLKLPLLKFLHKYRADLPKGFSVHISMDGVNCHDKQRSRSIDLVKDSISQVRNIFPAVEIKLKYTITPLNYADIIPTYEYARKSGLGFKVKLMENCKNYTNKVRKQALHLSRLMKKSIIESLSFIYEHGKSGGNIDPLFINDTIDSLLGNIRRTSCRAPFCRAFVMPDGKVYSCVHFGQIGNINKSSLDEIWTSAASENVRGKIKKEGCGGCVSYHGGTSRGYL